MFTKGNQIICYKEGKLKRGIVLAVHRFREARDKTFGKMLGKKPEDALYIEFQDGSHTLRSSHQVQRI